MQCTCECLCARCDRPMNMKEAADLIGKNVQQLRYLVEKTLAGRENLPLEPGREKGEAFMFKPSKVKAWKKARGRREKQREREIHSKVFDIMYR